mmetsp:Transcript_36130/g.77045  ORF Transcript_36130/g.77045 Transcript_36130/m.77045 type:complete len:364 (+) Transcript_36130:75-1166(+)
MMFPAAPAFLNLAALTARRRGPPVHWRGRTTRRARTMTSDGGGGENADDRNRFDFDEMEHRNWERGCEAYDEGFGPLTRRTVPALLANSGFPPPAAAAGIDGEEEEDGGTIRLLDVATGPGFVLSSAIDAALRSTDEGERRSFRLAGLDVTQNFLTLASRRIDAQLRGRQRSKKLDVDLVEGSAESLPFPEDAFDSVVCNFGILHFFDPLLFLRESHRVLRPGGRVAFSAWSPPPRTEGFGIALESIAEAGNPDVEGIPEGPAFFDFGDPDRATAALRDAGFEDVASTELDEMRWDNLRSGEMLYEVLSEGTSRTREVLLGQTPEEADAVRSMMAEKYGSITEGGRRPLSMPALVTSGRKPFR